MAANDFAAQNGTEKLSTNALSTVNGTSVSADIIEVQRVKVGFGVDGALRDVDASNGLPVVQSDVTATGTLTAAAQTVALSLAGHSGGTAQITGTWVGTLTFEASLDGTTWTAINAVSASTSAPQTTTTVNGLYRLTPAGTQQFRVNMTAFTSGSAVILLRASVGTGGVFANQILPTKITDGTNSAAIKAASTAAAATDPAVVVAISPNNAVAVTGTFWQATQPVSIATNTPDVTDRAARALGTIANTAFTANAGTNLNTSALALDATLTGGTQKSINRSGVKGTAVAGDITSNPVDANTEALHVNLAGVNAVNATLTAETTKVIGTVNVAASQTVGLVAGAAVIGSLAANQSVNTAQIGGIAPLMGNGVTGTGSQRVTIASDNTAFPVNATLTAETTKVIGTVNIAASQTVGLVAGTAVVGALVANQTVNNAQIAGVATATGSGVSGTGVQRVVLATDVVLPAVSEIRAATLHVSVTAAVNTALTVSLPAPAAGLYQYITHIELVKLYAVLGVAAAAGVLTTTANTSLVWTTEQAAGPLGTAPKVVLYTPTTPLRATAAATVTSFTAPAQTQTIWRWNVSYFTAA